MPESLFKKSCKPEPCSFITKETTALVFYCEFCEIYKNTFFYRAPPVTDSQPLYITLQYIADIEKLFELSVNESILIM